MSRVNWVNPSTMISVTMIKEVEQSLDVQFPDDFVKIVMEHKWIRAYSSGF